MTEVTLTLPTSGEVYVLGPGAQWDESLSRNITLWQIPGKGQDGMDLWCDSNTIRITVPYYDFSSGTDGGVQVDAKSMAKRIRNAMILNQSTMGNKNTWTLVYPLAPEGGVKGYVRNISFSQAAGHGDEINMTITFEVIHLA